MKNTHNIIAFIPAAGLGQRLWPITKMIPKEMFLIGNKPVIHYLIENIARAGISDVVIALRPSKRVIRDYLQDGRQFGIRIRYVQGSAVGIDQTLRAGKKYLSKNAFLLCVADLLFDNHTFLKELITLYKKHGVSIDALIHDPKKSLQSFAKPVGQKIDHRLWHIQSYVPYRDRRALPFVSIGVSILPPSFLHYLPSGNVKKETPLGEALNAFMTREPRYGYEIKSKIFDCSTSEGLVQATRHLLTQKK